MEKLLVEKQVFESVPIQNVSDRLRSGDRVRFLSESGSPLQQKYVASYDKYGVLQLDPDGEHNLYEDIQSFRASTDMNLILSRYLNGDPSVLSRVQGFYMDISEMPTNVHEAMTLMDRARSDFDKLPVDIKEKFNFDSNQFLASLGTDEWFDKMQVKQPVSETPAVDVQPAEGGVVGV